MVRGAEGAAAVVHKHTTYLEGDAQRYINLKAENTEP